MFNVVFINIIGKNMKRFFALAVLGIMFSSCSNSVYICTGPRSKAYHSTKKCKGLRRCSREIKQITLEEAKLLGRGGCRWCH